MQTPPSTPRQERPAPGAPRRQQRVRTPVRQRIRRSVVPPGAPRRPREDENQDENQDENEERERKERQDKFLNKIREADDEQNDKPLYKNPQTDLIVNNLKF